ncbi:PepSY-associated TM helix domain-containing protein [Nitrosomonas sp.]|uniref:PepSY-associated TM helix domain-containing protein n=1 Tax=Nitrosomonas sp. TaxID=42353 RepID=UPI0025F9F4E0|nr:PepSY-associated TM helix domain-containing protein [Nitrosomonas sp.]
MLDYNRIILDPVSGNEIERHQWGAISDGWRNLMSFVYNLHYSLALGMAGVWILGICALVWTIDCFVGCYLTLPARKKNRQVAAAKLLQANGNDWWQRWKPAWKIRWRSGNYKLNFDLHRANGLWFWILLIIFICMTAKFIWTSRPIGGLFT